MNAANVRTVASMLVKALLCLVAAMLFTAAGAPPVEARGDKDRGGRHDNGRYENRGRGHEPERYVRGRRVHRSPVYRERVYVSPPVVYVPPPPPGISIFLPPIIFRP